MSLQKTLAMIKPDAADRADQILDYIEAFGFVVLAKKRVQLTAERAAEFYAEHKERPFFGSLVEFMSSGPIYALVLAKTNAIRDWRALMGPTNSNKARESHPHSIRAIFGTDGQRNATHGSDSPASAAREIKFHFPNILVEPVPTGQVAKDYLQFNLQPTLIEGLTALCKAKPDDPIVWLSDWLLENNPNKPKVEEPEDD